VHDTTSSDEVRTKDEDEKGSDEIPTSSLKANNDHANDDHSYKSDEQEGGQDFPVNEDLEENYEDRHDGISVRQPDDVDMTNDDDDLKLDDMNLDDNESVDSDSKNEGSSIGNVADELNNHLEDDTQVGDVPESNNESPPDGDIHTPDEKDGSDLQDDSDSMTASGVNDQDHNQRKATDAQGIHDENGRDEISELFQQQEDNHRAKGDEMKEERQETDIDGGKEGLNIDDRRFHSGDDGIRQDLGDNLESTANIPNPFRDPGDAEKYWHRRLNLLHRSESNGDMNIDDEIKEDEKPQPQNSAGLYEFVQSNQSSSAQVLADSDENNDVNIQPKDKSKEIKREPQSNDPMETLDDGADVEDNGGMGKSGKKSERNSKVNDRRHSDEDGAKEGEEKGSDENLASSSETNTNHGQKLNELNADQYSLLHGDSEEKFEQTNIIAQQHESQSSGTDNAAILWGKLQSETHHLSRRLCEKLRLVMEPLVASKLQGDYRSGKRLNMKRIISYIASGYRKDKIWLRRTKPAKRDYRVMLAVDDSESMKSSGAGLMALRAISMLINGMTQLEVGQLGIASFGEEMKILHPFECPFTSESGASLVGNFRFEDKRTRTALCVESAMASMARESSSLSPQLLLLISDGRIERDSRSRLRSSLREMSEQNILVVMLIIEGSTETKKKDRILDIKEVSFEDGKPKVNFFMDNYPFPYYIIVEDLNDLPEILGDALRQWFEILAQTQK
jgi:midasin